MENECSFVGRFREISRSQQSRIQTCFRNLAEQAWHWFIDIAKDQDLNHDAGADDRLIYRQNINNFRYTDSEDDGSYPSNNNNDNNENEVDDFDDESSGQNDVGNVYDNRQKRQRRQIYNRGLLYCQVLKIALAQANVITVLKFFWSVNNWHKVGVGKTMIPKIMGIEIHFRTHEE